MSKKIILNFLLLFLLLELKSQSILPNDNTVFCPLTNTTFTVTLPGTGYYSIYVIGWNDIAPANVVPGSMTSPYTSGGSTHFTFVGNFADNNCTQAFRVNYIKNSVAGSATFKFTRIKSFLNATIETTPQTNISSITAPRCQISNYNINFPYVPFKNSCSNLGIGSTDTYEYLLPTGWKLNGVSSNGSTWLTGTVNATITSDLSNGHQGFVRIRAVNTCAPNLLRGAEKIIPISRPRPNLTISGDNFLCSGSKTYSINGTLTPGSTVCWSSSVPSYASFPNSPANCGTSSNLTFNTDGIVKVIATITDCIETYTISKDVLIGKAIGGYYGVQSNYHNSGIQNTLGFNNGAIWLPASQSFGVNVTLNSPGLQSATWSRSTSSYPFYWTNVGTALSFSGSSGTVGYQQRTGIFNVTAQTSCGVYNGTYNWPVIVQGWSSFSVTTAPNPTKGILTITVKNNSEEKSSPKIISDPTIIKLHTISTGNTIKTWKFEGGQEIFNLNLSDIQKGQYVLSIHIGEKIESKIILIE